MFRCVSYTLLLQHIPIPTIQRSSSLASTVIHTSLVFLTPLAPPPPPPARPPLSFVTHQVHPPSRGWGGEPLKAPEAGRDPGELRADHIRGPCEFRYPQRVVRDQAGGTREKERERDRGERERERGERKEREKGERRNQLICRIDYNRESISVPPSPSLSSSSILTHSHPFSPIAHPSNSSARTFSSSSPWPTPRQLSRQTRLAMLLARSPSSSAQTKSLVSSITY